MYLVVLVLMLVNLVTVGHPLIRAEVTTSDIQNQINLYTKKLDELGKSKDTLANQLNLLTSERSLTELKISQIEISIKTLKEDIEKLTSQIGDLDISLNKISSAYLNQVSTLYKQGKDGGLLTMIIKKNFQSFYQYYKYLTTVQNYNRQLLLNLETIRTNYDFQKQNKAKKQLELEELQKKLAEQKSSLKIQEKSKSTLLEITKNDEKKYQELKRAAENELSYLLKAKFTGKRYVKKGEIIGLMGNSGYSFGDHLHFSLYNLKEDNLASFVYANDIDPFSYLKQYGNPMENPNMTQGRGATQYSYLYKDRFHHGVDFVSDNKSVRAINEGEAYFYRNAGGFGNHVRIFHPDGKMTLYLHLQ